MGTPNLAVLPDSPGQVASTPQRTYTSADYETAFHVWHGPAGRSLNKTAAITGYPRATVQTWADRHHWQERADEAANPSGLSAATAADRIVRELLDTGKVRAILGMLGMIADPGHRKHYEACEWMLAQTGYPTPKAPSVTQKKTLGDGSVLEVKGDLSHLTTAQLAHYARTGELPASVPDPDTD